ncbi:hypothetical protein J6590_089211 [Homalodisca vitripennis]|nr:hypothetical protein J6590_089211 [Homalodisca vitripennis]
MLLKECWTRGSGNTQISNHFCSGPKLGHGGRHLFADSLYLFANKEISVRRRTTLSITRRDFDPIAITCPITLCPLCRMRVGLTNILGCKGGRRNRFDIHIVVGYGNKGEQLNGAHICDTSKDAYATAKYVDSSVTGQFILAILHHSITTWSSRSIRGASALWVGGESDGFDIYE